MKKRNRGKSKTDGRKDNKEEEKERNEDGNIEMDSRSEEWEGNCGGEIMFMEGNDSAIRIKC